MLLAGICASAQIAGEHTSPLHPHPSSGLLGKELHSFAIVTTKVSGDLPGKRQPVVLGTPDRLQLWLTQRHWTESLDDMISTPHNNTLVPLER